LRTSLGFVIVCALTVAQSFAAQAASPVVRVKAKLTAFDGQVMTLTPLPSKDASAKTENFSVSILPDTRYVRADKTSLDGVKPGAYAGAAVTEEKDGSLRAADIYLYAEALRGSGEGRFFEAERLIVNGAVSAVQPPAADGKQPGSLTLHYRGAVLSGLGRGKTLCEGRASPPAYASALACRGDAVIQVPAAAPVSALTVGDKSLLVPGSLVTVAMTKAPDNKDVTLGVIVEKSVANPPTPP
jgi:hypothetical protein